MSWQTKVMVSFVLSCKLLSAPRKLKPRPKHPAKLHIWGAISSRGVASVVMFTGIMDAICFGKILDASLVPFVAECFPDNHCFQIKTHGSESRGQGGSTLRRPLDERT